MAEAVLSRAGEPLDLIVWRNRGRTGGLVEAALGLNPGLADLGPELPGDVTIRLPDDSTAPPVRPTVKLWG